MSNTPAMMGHVEHPYCIGSRFETDDDSMNDVEIDMDEITPFKITLEEYRRRVREDEITIPRECDEILFRNLLIKRVSRRPQFWWDEPDTVEGVCHNGEWIWVAMEVYERSGWLYECDYLVRVWKQLRDNYRLELIKIDELGISPQEEERTVTWIYFKKMSFIRHDMQLQIRNGNAVRNRRQELRKRLYPVEDQTSSGVLEKTSMNEDGPSGRKMALHDHMMMMESKQKNESSGSLVDQSHVFPPQHPISEEANYQKDADYIYSEVLRILRIYANDAEKLTDLKRKILNFLWGL